MKGGIIVKKKFWEKRWVKGTISVLLCAALVMGNVPFVPKQDAVEVQAAASVVYEPSRLNVNVLPMAMESQSSFMNNYIKKGKFNITSLFTARSYRNIREKTNLWYAKPLSYNTLLMHNGNDDWFARHIWYLNYNEIPELKYLILDGQIQIGYQGNLTSDKHTNFYNHWSKKWDVASVYIEGDSIGESGKKQKLISTKSKKENNDVAVSTGVLTKRIPKGSWPSMITFYTGHEGCNCGSSKVANTCLWLVDKEAPVVKETYVSYDQEGTERILQNDGFSATGNGKTDIYITMVFSEPVRFANNEAEVLTLQLDQFDTLTGNTSAQKATANLIELSDRKMIFKYTIPEDTTSNYYVTGISGTQNWTNGKDFTGYIIDSGGNVYNKDKVNFKSTSKITDLAGNALNWQSESSALDFPYAYYVDNVAPTLEEIRVTGSMISTESATSKNEWPADIDRSSVFAGVNDQLQFTAYFSEAFEEVQTENIKAYLNLYDTDKKEQVSVNLKSYHNSTRKDVFGQNETEEPVTYLKFEKITITETMVPLNTGANVNSSTYDPNASLDGSPIQITRIEGIDNVTKDRRGNAVTGLGTKVNVKPEQQEYLDVIGANASLALEEQEDSGGKYYEPTATENGFEFSIPIIVNDDESVGSNGDYTSLSEGVNGRFYLVMDNYTGTDADTKTFYYSYKLPGETAWSLTRMGATEETSSKVKFTQLGGANSSTIKISLYSTEDYNYNSGSQFKATLYVVTKDHAGNEKVQSFKLRHEVDKKAADIYVVSQNVTETENSDGTTTITMSAEVNIRDWFGVSEVTYQWGNGDIVTYPLTDTQTTSKDFTITITSGDKHKYDTLGSNDDSITVTDILKVNVKDKAENVSEQKQEEFSYYYGRPQSNYSLKYYKGNYTQGVFFSESDTNSETEPALYVYMKQEKPAGNGAKTLVFLDAGDGTFYVRVPLDKDDNTITDGIVYDVLGIATPDANNLDCKWYKLTGGAISLETATETERVYPKGIFTNAELLTDTAEVETFITDYYGALTMYIVTSKDFAGTFDTVVSNKFKFGETKNTTVDVETVYLAALGIKDSETGEEYYQADVDDSTIVIKNAEGERTSSGTVDSADGYSISFGIQNLIETAEEYNGIKYGDHIVTEVEFSIGKIENGSANVIYSEILDKESTYTVTIPDGVMDDAGEYNCYLYVSCMVPSESGNLLATFNVCPEEVDMTLDAYTKTYKKDNTEIKVADVSNLASTDTDEITIGLAKDPEGWTSTSTFTFKMGEFSEAVQNAGFTTVGTNFRIWNAADDNGAVNAGWNYLYVYNEDSHTYTYHKTWDYTPMLVTEFTEDSYKNYQIPLTTGINTLVYEVQNINGVVKTGRILVNVLTNIDDFGLNVTEEYSDSNNIFLKGYKIVPQLSPAMQAQIDAGTLTAEFAANTLEGNNGTPVDANDLFKGFTYTDSGRYEYILYDSNGNMTTQIYTIEAFDKQAPAIQITDVADANTDTNGVLGNSENTFYVKMQVTDAFELDIETLKLTFDANYSGLLNGLTGEARTTNTEQVSMYLPLTTVGEWEELSTQNNGIYRMKVTENKADKDYTVELWGTLKYDAELSNAKRDVALTFTVCDAVGYETAVAQVITADNVKPELKARENAYGGLEIYSTVPISDVDGYGAGNLYFDSENIMYTWIDVSVDGVYSLVCADLFGESASQDVTIRMFDNSYVKFSVSEIKITNQDVVVTAQNLKKEEGYSIKDISVNLPDAEGLGSIDEDGNVASIVVTENAYVDVVLSNTNPEIEDVEVTLVISNIDKELQPATIVFQYNGGEEPTFIDADNTTVVGPVTAVVVCDPELAAYEEDFEGANGSLTYDFLEGSKKGDTYAFEYRDDAGNVGTITATLEYNVGPENLDGTQETEDKEAPQYTLELLAQRFGVFAHLASLTKTVSAELKDGDTIDSSIGIDVTGAQVNKVYNDYTAQAYAMNFVINDMSATKIILRNAGSSAPTSYFDTSEMIDGVTLNGTLITITKNMKFDVYIVDEKNYVTALTGIDVAKVDTEAPVVEVTKDAYTDKDGYGVVKTLFTVVGNEFIQPLVDKISVQLVDNGNTVQYYWEFRDNGEETFKYQDIYGNIGEQKVTIEGLDNTTPRITKVVWHTNNVYGSTNAENWRSVGTMMNWMRDAGIDDNIINQNVELEINLNKPIRDISFQDSSFKPVDLEAAGITVEYTGKIARIIFSKNTEKIYIVRIMANGNDVKTTIEVPFISCIDKESPDVKSDGGKLSKDNLSKTYIFTTNTWAYNNDCKYDSTEAANARTTHTWTVYKNGTYTIIFSDKAGNSTKQTIVVNDIDDKLLTLSFSKNADGSQAVSDASELNIRLGNTFYVKANKAAKLTWAGQTNLSVAADAWTQLTLPTEAGFYTIKAVDSSTGRTIYNNVAIQLKDKVAPTISFDDKTIYLEANASLEEMKAALNKGVTVQDNQDSNVAFTYTGAPDTVKAGVYTITYKAQDGDGNRTQEMRTLYIYSGEMLRIQFNGNSVAPYATQIVDNKKIKIDVDYEGEGDLVIMYKEGIKTTGQMKYNSTRIENGDTIQVEESGFYSVYVRTQDRTELIFYLFVAE